MKELGKERHTTPRRSFPAKMITQLDRNFDDLVPYVPTNLIGIYISEKDTIAYTNNTINHLKGISKIEEIKTVEQNRALCAIFHEILHSYHPAEKINSIENNDIVDGIVEIMAREITYKLTKSKEGLDTYPDKVQNAMEFLKNNGILPNLESLKDRYLSDSFN